MEREGEVGGRGEGKKKRGRRGIIVGGIALLLVLGCNNGGELEAEKRLSAIGRSAENVFYSFMDLIADSLGFTVKADTTKQQVGQHFITLGTKLEQASVELEKVAEKSATEVDKDGPLSKAIREAVYTAKNTLSVLKGHLESLKDIGNDGQKVGYTANDSQGAAAADTEIKTAITALKGIVEIADKEGVKKPEVGSTVLTANNKDGAKVLATVSSNKPAASVGGKASAILSTVSGNEMLASIVASEESKVKELQAQADANTTPLEFAKGANDGNHLNQTAAKAAAVAGGIALRSLVKSGQLSSHQNNDNEAVQAAGVTAVKKLLVAVEDIIKKTVKNVLGKARLEIDKARDSKIVGQK